MKIQLKRSVVLDGDAAKAPDVNQMKYGELAVNYNLADPALFLKVSDNATEGGGTEQVVRLAGAGSTGVGDGTLTINNSDGTPAGTFTANQSTDTTIALPAGFSGDYDDLTNSLTAGNGINIDDSNEITAVAYSTYGIAVEAQGIRIGDDWSSIPTLV